jgi:outer membrane protein insertion porin family
MLAGAALVLLGVGCQTPGTPAYMAQQRSPLSDRTAAVAPPPSNRDFATGKRSRFVAAPPKPAAGDREWQVEGAGYVVRGQQENFGDPVGGGFDNGLGGQGDIGAPRGNYRNDTIPNSELNLGLGNEPMLNEGSEWSPGSVGPTADLDVVLNEARTGRFSVGVGVNSDAGLSGQIIVDERNFNWAAVPTSMDDVINGRAFRGAGQGFRLEALPGDQFQRYLMSFTEPYLWGTPISFSLSGYFFDRRYQDWDEQRMGGRFGFGYRLTPDLSVSTSLRMEDVNIHDPRIRGVSELEEVLGDNSLFSARFGISHDTRDVPFFPTEGHFLDMSFTQAFGTFDYPRAEFDYRQYFMLKERPDGSGRHTLAYTFKAGFSGANTPLFENYFAGGYTTLRGFDFRGASPVNGGVVVGGEFRFLGAVEYFFPLTADDMIKGVLFCDFGTVEENIEINADDYRVAPGFGLRISVPAMGPAPIALDFAIPVIRENTDTIKNFSFFFGYTRGG